MGPIAITKKLQAKHETIHKKNQLVGLNFKIKMPPKQPAPNEPKLLASVLSEHSFKPVAFNGVENDGKLIVLNRPPAHELMAEIDITDVSPWEEHLNDHQLSKEESD